MTGTSTHSGDDGRPPDYYTDAPVYPFDDDPQPPDPEQPDQGLPEPPPPDYAEDAAAKAMADHEANCGCIMPANRMPPQAEQQASTPPPMWYPGGWFGIPISVPSQRQNRTTQLHPRARMHPINRTKPLSITTWIEQNPDTWPDGNPT